MRTDSHTHSPNEADKISARVARLPHPTSIAWMLGPPGPQPDSSWRDSRMAYRRKPSAFGISVGGGAAMSRNAPTAACRSFYTWARSSLGRSTSASVPRRRRRRWSSRGPSCRSNSYSYPPCLVTRYVTFFDVFKVVSKVLYDDHSAP